jgi:hypothetical protein
MAVVFHVGLDLDSSDKSRIGTILGGAAICTTSPSSADDDDDDDVT